MNKRIPVIGIPVLNRFDLLEKTILSIDFAVDNLFIIDNSNTYVPSPGIYGGKLQVLNMPANMGVAGSWNLIIKCFPHAPYWLIGSNDTVFTPSALEQFCQLSRNGNIVMSDKGWHTFSIGSEIVKRIGLFDENYYPAYSEDDDYMARLRAANMTDRIVWSSIHMEIPTGESMTIHSNDHFRKKNLFTNEQNFIYRGKKLVSDNPHLNCMQYDLQRRIDHEWLDVN